MDEDGLSAARDDADDEPASDPDHDAESPSESNASAVAADTPAEKGTSDETLESTDERSGESDAVDADGDEVATGGDADDTRPTDDANDARLADDDREDEAEVEPESASMPSVPDTEPEASDVPEDVQKYARFKKMDGAQYDRVNEFLRDRTYITAREWAIARLCSDFRTETGVEMTKIGENLPELVPFMTDTYTPQAVNQARSSFEEKVRTAGATFLYGAMCDFFTAEELDDVMYESTEVAKFLLEVEGVDLSVEDELEAEERISSVMRDVREASEQLREEDDT
ncbi:DUF5806 family protein [Natronorubrum daqingense]|uniref:Uncharacterized protein n=1 Tax=Natronorubrum daqingense TaxID=588898 RepID=A0A1N7FQH5_9EURY|nr:DUF5806 family protein [Natronorubrum daqingense]APX97332.1 hypothetical protein BB347_12305 [Natronorubrum daqingense]SIS02537.1 hypothetical protein SAMN05421809_3399 [Natronorubrum daqingense]